MSSVSTPPSCFPKRTLHSPSMAGSPLCATPSCVLQTPRGQTTPKTLPSFVAIQHTSTPTRIQKEMRKWKLDDFEVNKDQLGKGMFGCVYLAREKSTKFRVALKILYKDQLKGKMHDQLKREIVNQANLRHPNILRLYAYFYDDCRIYLVLEYAPGGQLFDLLSQKQRFDDETASVYVGQVADALHYCHSKGIIHRDIKPENILVDKNGDLKLADFGWSVHRDPSCYRTTFCGTFAYMSPEMLLNQEYTEKVDVWSLGVLCFELLVGNVPFEVIDEKDNYINTWNGEIKIPTYVSAAAKDLIRNLLKRDPSTRICIKTALAHRWITKYKKDKTSTPRRVCS